jgi:hypothetical protein
VTLARAGVALAVLLGATAGVAHAQHAHGVANLDVALEGRSLTLEFRAPAEDVLGFERKPASDKDRAALESAASYFKAGRGFVPSAAANCRPLESVVEVEERGKAHFEVVARLAYDCKEPGSLAEIEAAVFAQHKRVKRIDVRSVTGKGQSSARLTPAKPKLAL